MSEIFENEFPAEAASSPEPELPTMIPEGTKAAPPRRVPLTHRTAAKVTAFILAVVMVFLTVGCVAGAVAMWTSGIYTTSEWAFRDMAFTNLTEGDAVTLIHYLESENGETDAMHFLGGRNIANVEMTFSSGSRNTWGYDGGVTAGSTEYTSRWCRVSTSEGTWLDRYEYYDDEPEVEVVQTIDVTIRLADNFREHDEYWLADWLISLAYAMRYWVYVIGVAALLLFVVCFVFLMCASGRRAGQETVQIGWGTRVPLDITTAAAGVSGFVALCLVFESYGWVQVVVTILAALAFLVIVLGWCMSFALRIKLGGWWRNTLIYHVLRLLWRVFKSVCRGLRAFFRAFFKGFSGLLRNIPLVWKTALLLAGIAFLNLLLLAFNHAELDNLLILWFLEAIVLCPAILYIALMLRKLQRGGAALAAGDLSYQVDTRRMVLEFKQHGENLNRIGEGMTAAVEQRMKSERMKTELITNVSHDIKTPLTSIINYADLIGKEPSENETITEYAGVLHRQSERLRRLIDDLVEASKASTGNLDILLAPCAVGVLLTQTAGEYEQRLKSCNLELIARQPEQPVKILADGRRLWRVMDNLMNNICKYAQSGTRVYLTLEETGGQAVISFKNTSREPLDLSGDELLERFVRGDAARASDGNGLGLSIAKSLTELQKGSLEVTTDGDLFKVVLRFPLV